jgi:hypothetical protein
MARSALSLLSMNRSTAGSDSDAWNATAEAAATADQTTTARRPTSSGAPGGVAVADEVDVDVDLADDKVAADAADDDDDDDGEKRGSGEACMATVREAAVTHAGSRPAAARGSTASLCMRDADRRDDETTRRQREGEATDLPTRRTWGEEGGVEVGAARGRHCVRRKERSIVRHSHDESRRETQETSTHYPHIVV